MSKANSDLTFDMYDAYSKVLYEQGYTPLSEDQWNASSDASRSNYLSFCMAIAVDAERANWGLKGEHAKTPEEELLAPAAERKIDDKAWGAW